MFRSHLMQQFVSVAKAQSRPPLALASSLSRGRQKTATQSADEHQQQPDARLEESASASVMSSLASSSSRRRVPSVTTAAVTPASGLSSQFSRRTLSVDSSSAPVTAPRPMPVEHNATAALFQSLIQSRRTVARWDNDGNAQIDTAFLSGALDRAILCARHAPNHKRTEPFRFVRMLHQHGGIEQLANICCHVTLQRKLPKDPEHAESLAASKRDKWASIPAYLVTLVDQSKRGEAEENEESTDHLGDYEELPFVPPRTERQLEDYASASAAVQNVLLSLHAEGLATKWATGPIVNTRAFRNLCRVRETERVVGLVMVGVAALGDSSSSSPIKPRRFRKTWDDLVQDF